MCGFKPIPTTLAPNNNKTIYYDNQKFGLVTQGDDAKQFVPQYKGLQKNIALLEDASAGLGSMSIGNNDSIKKTKAKNNYIFHKIKRNETLSHIAMKYKTSVRKIKKWNGLRNNKIKYGTKLKIYTN